MASGERLEIGNWKLGCSELGPGTYRKSRNTDIVKVDARNWQESQGLGRGVPTGMEPRSILIGGSVGWKTGMITSFSLGPDCNWRQGDCFRVRSTTAIEGHYRRRAGLGCFRRVVMDRQAPDHHSIAREAHVETGPPGGVAVGRLGNSICQEHALPDISLPRADKGKTSEGR